MHPRFPVRLRTPALPPPALFFSLEIAPLCLCVLRILDTHTSEQLTAGVARMAVMAHLF